MRKVEEAKKGKVRIKEFRIQNFKRKRLKIREPCNIMWITITLLAISKVDNNLFNLLTANFSIKNTLRAAQIKSRNDEYTRQAQSIG